ncbi:MAG TPA: tRNA pseudouridine(38-40) synthase TruA [Ruminococcaceae bacterium]|nr:tRNA pseudouridine(38-40) synthase TruA [Oscillospiraceae bacterium]
MKRYKLSLCFDGTKYHGWQVQKNAVTVQQTVQDAMGRLFGVRPALTGCSRTDAGVHARAFCAHTDIDTEIPAGRIPYALRHYLPPDISAVDCEEASGDFHARYSAKSKEYVYKIYNRPHPNPFYRGYALHIERPLDTETMNRAAKAFLGRHDFSAFRASGSGVEDTVRTVFDAGVHREGDIILFTVRADGFLYNMVRIMTGTLLEIAYGKTEPEQIPVMIARGDRSVSGPTAPAHGLYLNRVLYYSQTT